MSQVRYMDWSFLCMSGLHSLSYITFKFSNFWYLAMNSKQVQRKGNLSFRRQFNISKGMRIYCKHFIPEPAKLQIKKFLHPVSLQNQDSSHHSQVKTFLNLALNTITQIYETVKFNKAVRPPTISFLGTHYCSACSRLIPQNGITF